MAIEFKPASPINTAVAEQFGRTEQFNRFAPLQASMYEADARNRTQASIATAENQTRASATSAELQGRKQFMDSEQENAREMQRRQFFAQREMQQQAIQGRLIEQQMENDRYNMAITKAEEMDYVQQQNGLNELEKMHDEGSLDDAQYRAHRFQLMTKVKHFENRRMDQQAKQVQQATMIQQKAFDDNQKNIALAKQFAKNLGGRELMELTNPDTGATEIFDFDTQKGMWSKIGVRKPVEEKPESISPYADESGGFSYKKALPEAKAEAEAAYPVIKGEEGGDTNAQKRAEYMQEMIRKREDEHRAGMNRKAPVTAPQQGGGGQIDRPSAAEPIKQQLRAIQAQYPNGNAPPEVKQQHAALLAQLKSMSQ